MDKEELIRYLVEVFGRKNVITDDKLSAEYTKDMCLQNFISGDTVQSCLAVIRINETLFEELKILVGLVKGWGKKLVVRGGGSGVCGAVIPREPRNTIIIDMTGMDSVYEINTLEGFVYAGAGIKGDRLEEAVQSRGYTIGHSPASLAISTLGGWLATRSSGQFSARYGTIEDLVLEIEAITADGQIRTFTGKEMGSFLRMEGTTGIIIRAKIKIFPVVRHKEYLAISFKNLQKALKFVYTVSQTRNELERNNVWLSALRLYDFVDYHLVAKPHKEETKSVSSSVSRVEKLILIWPWLVNCLFVILGKINLLKNMALIVLESDSVHEIIKAKKNTLNMAGNFSGFPENPKITEVWSNNRFKLNHKKLLKMLEEGFIIDTLDSRPSYPDSIRAIELYRTIKKFSNRLVLSSAHFGIDRKEIYLYFTFIRYVANQTARKEIFARLWSYLLEACLVNNAFSTHHHGVGMLKSGPSNIFSPYTYGKQWFEQIAVPAKQKLDPDNIFNPGNII